MSTTQSDSIEWQRNVPVRYDADVAVVGGGIAGVSAACAAAKSGARVILVERFAVTGGVLTTGGVANFCGQMHEQGEVFDEMIAQLKSFNAIGQERESVFHYEILAVVLQEMLLARGVKLLLHTRFVDARARDGRIGECIVCGKSGLEAIRAHQFIDTTGEADTGCGLSSKEFDKSVVAASTSHRILRTGFLVQEFKHCLSVVIQAPYKRWIFNILHTQRIKVFKNRCVIFLALIVQELLHSGSTLQKNLSILFF